MNGQRPKVPPEPPKPLGVPKDPFVSTPEGVKRLYGYRAEPPESTVKKVTAAPPTGARAALTERPIKKLTPEEKYRINRGVIGDLSQLFATYEPGKRSRAVGKDAPGTEDVALSVMANRLASGSDQALLLAYRQALATKDTTLLETILVSRMPEGWTPHAPYVAREMISSEPLSVQTGALSEGTSLNKTMRSMGKLADKLEEMHNLPSSKKLQSHIRLMNLRPEFPKETPEYKAIASQLGKFVGTLKAIIADAKGDDRKLFVAQPFETRKQPLEPVRVREGGQAVPYEGPEAPQDVHVPFERKWSPQQTVGEALKELLFPQNADIPKVWEDLVEIWGLHPLEENSPVSKEQQIVRLVLQDADLYTGLGGYGFKELARQAGFDVSTKAIEDAAAKLKAMGLHATDSRPLVEEIAALSDQDVVALAVGSRVGIQPEEVPYQLTQAPAVTRVGTTTSQFGISFPAQTYTFDQPAPKPIDIPEKWALARTDSLGRALTEIIASGDDAKAAMAMRAISAVWPEQYYRLASQDVGEFGTWQQGMHQASSEAARHLNDLSIESAKTPPASKTREGKTIVEKEVPNLLKLVDPAFAKGLSKASGQYKPDGKTPYRPPIAPLPDGLSLKSPEFLQMLSLITQNPYRAFQSWLDSPQMVALLPKLSGNTLAKKIQNGILSGLIAEPIYESESRSYDVRKTILKNLWRQMLEDPKTITKQRIAFLQALGIDVPEPIVQISKTQSQKEIFRAREIIEASEEAVIDIGSMSDDFSESLR